MKLHVLHHHSRRGRRRHSSQATLVACATVGWLTSAASAQEPAPVVPLACGDFVTRSLDSGATDLVAPIETGASTVLVEVTDATGTLGALRLRSTALNPSNETCGGSLTFVAGRARGDAIEVGDCLDDDSGTYTIGFNVVSDGPDNCGRSLGGAGALQAALDRAGEVDAYAITSTGDERMEFAATPAERSAVGAIRLRLFDPEGELLADSCSGSIDESADAPGRYTALASACDGIATGAYSIERIGATDLASPPEGEIVYVVNAETGNIAVIDPASGGASTSIQLVERLGTTEVTHLVANPNKSFLYTYIPESGRIFALETPSNRLLSAIPAPALNGPYLPLAVHPSGTELLASAPRLGGIARIDLASGRTIGVIPVPGIDEQSLAISPDGNTAYVTTSTSDAGEAIAFVDLAAGNVVDSVAKASQHEPELSVSPDGTQLWSYDFESAIVVDTTARTIAQMIEAQFYDLVFHPTEPIAYATGGWIPGDDVVSVHVLDTDSLSILREIPLPGADFPLGISLSRDQRLLYVADSGGEFDPTKPRDSPPGLHVVDIESGVVLARYTTLGTTPTDVVAVTPPQGLCTGDAVAQTKVTVGELVTSVRYAVDGCPDEPMVPPLSARPAE